MFRYVTNLKALTIDTESFSDVDLNEWGPLIKQFKCLFIVSDVCVESRIKELFPDSYTYDISEKKSYFKLFGPNIESHSYALKTLQINATEMAYLSRDLNFLKNAFGFFGGTIWITNSITYDEASNAPDLICQNLKAAISLLSNNVQGFLGECVLNPNSIFPVYGMIIPVEFEVSGRIINISMLGRYFGYSHYMNQLHPYSAAIALNKNTGKRYTGIFNDIFTQLYILAISRIQENCSIDGLVSVPARPGAIDRFQPIREKICHECIIEDLGSYFTCIKDYPTQRYRSTSWERQENISGVFNYNGSLYRKNIIVIDDIITTGSTLSECINVLYNHGANEIHAVALGINQLNGNYWSSDTPQVSCPVCGKKMRMMVNSNSKEFFFSCLECYHPERQKGSTLNYDAGIENLITWVNSKFRI